MKWGCVVDKPQFAAAPESSSGLDETACSSTPPAPASAGKTPTNEEQTKDPVSNPILDQESLTAVLRFFELLDGWDRKEEQP